MTVTPKTAGAVATVLGGGAAAGVGIHHLSKEAPVNKAFFEKLETVKDKFKLALQETDCRKLIENEETSENDYIAAILGCAKSKTFSSIANNLNLEVLKADNVTDSSGTEKTKWDKKWEKNSDAIKTLKTETGGTAWSSLSDAADKIKEFCKKEDQINKNTKTADWYKFLKICVKEDEEGTNKPKPLAEALTKDFWHSQITMGAKMKAAKFTDKTSGKGTTCTEENLNKPYKAEGYKDLVIECSELSNFKARAEALQLTAYPSTNGDDFWKTGWDDVKDRVASSITFKNGNKDSWEKAKTEVKAYCQGESSQNKTITKTTENEEWKKYLNACTKDKDNGSKTKDIVAKDFWTGEEIKVN